MVGFHARVDDSHDDAHAGAHLLCFSNVDCAEMPLTRAAGVRGGRRRQQRKGQQAAQRGDRNLPWEVPHRSIPITPGPASNDIPSSSGWITGATPCSTAHGLSGSHPRPLRSCFFRPARWPLVMASSRVGAAVLLPPCPMTPLAGLGRRPAYAAVPFTIPSPGAPPITPPGGIAFTGPPTRNGFIGPTPPGSIRGPRDGTGTPTSGGVTSIAVGRPPWVGNVGGRFGGPGGRGVITPPERIGPPTPLAAS